jgi:hypothetical protein
MIFILRQVSGKRYKKSVILWNRANYGPWYVSVPAKNPTCARLFFQLVPDSYEGQRGGRKRVPAHLSGQSKFWYFRMPSLRKVPTCMESQLGCPDCRCSLIDTKLRRNNIIRIQIESISTNPIQSSSAEVWYSSTYVMGRTGLDSSKWTLNRFR